ncbi:coxsackievirus and adenovirus receptor homolog isoform X2 [Stegostoma tigrinum]|uniref:coxsackievirus and adenovirus receptor homolog isoform X2 n=1 Tax=Stegostoma tigrinum TaxID=3053191 RepID=UPI00286FE484|nr:coxsackievirus and adenovirus receptor homolog isoform X2 [Stegostoma tigrinum]
MARVNHPSPSASHFVCQLPSARTLVYLSWTIAGLGCALRITSTGPQTLHVAEGESADIGCQYQVEATDLGALDVEWSIMSPDTTKVDQVVLTYAHEEVFEYPSPVSGRLSFLEADPSLGNASVRLVSLRITDTNTFQCKVKKAPGIDSRKVTVGVHVRPQKPECWIDRSGEQGQDVRLHCVSHLGSPPLTYSWARISKPHEGLPRGSTADHSSGILLIRNSTSESYGTYQCTVRNLVGHEDCLIILSAGSDSRDVGPIVGAVLGTLLALLLLLFLLWLLCCRRHRKHNETAYDIREDALPPVSREPSIRSVRSYKAHQARKDRRLTFYRHLQDDSAPQDPAADPAVNAKPLPARPRPVYVV